MGVIGVNSRDGLHIQNFFDNITKGTTLHSDIDSGYKSTLLVQMGNLTQRTGYSLDINPANGHIVKYKEAQQL